MQKTFSVSEINNYIKNRLEGDVILNDVWINGEITNIRYYEKGAMVYFSLCDVEAQINCVMYDSSLLNLKFELKNGLKVSGRGKIKVFNKKGSYNFQVSFMLPHGKGDLAKEFEILKKKLFDEGLFDPERKKPIPKYPKTLALVTAYDSAAMWDFITIAQKSAPHLKLIVVPAVMQGAQSALSIINALKLIIEYNVAPQDLDLKIDLVIILRGGGSAEDLASFNDEQLIRFLALFPYPFISAVGHEIDYTLTDFVADLRMPTPTAAAQAICQPFLELKTYVADILRNLQLQTEGLVQENKQETAFCLERITQKITSDFNQKKQFLDQLIIRLEQANPLHKMRQGYSVTRLAESKEIIKSIKQIKTGNMVQTDLLDGSFQSEVTFPLVIKHKY